MYTSHVIVDWLSTVKEKLPEFHYLKKDFYDPSLDFDNRIRSYVVKYDSQETDGSEEDWIGIVWNRGVIQDAADVQDRQFQALEKNFSTALANQYSVKMAKTSFEIAYFSNSLDYIEDFEESHYLTFNKLFTHKVLLPVFGWTDVAFTQMTLGSINKLDRNDKGTIVELSFSFEAIFPVAKLVTGRTNLPLIGEILDGDGNPTGKPKVNLSILFEIC